MVSFLENIFKSKVFLLSYEMDNEFELGEKLETDKNTEHNKT